MYAKEKQAYNIKQREVKIEKRKKENENREDSFDAVHLFDSQVVIIVL